VEESLGRGGRCSTTLTVGVGGEKKNKNHQAGDGTGRGGGLAEDHQLYT